MKVLLDVGSNEGIVGVGLNEGIIGVGLNEGIIGCMIIIKRNKTKIKIWIEKAHHKVQHKATYLVLHVVTSIYFQNIRINNPRISK